MDYVTKNKLFLPIMGVFAGIANGLLGAGGGIIVVYALNAALGASVRDPRDVFANALCIMLPISGVSVIGYALMGNLSFVGLGSFVLPAIVGGVCGGFLLGKINAAFLQKLFAVIVIYSGLMLMIK